MVLVNALPQLVLEIGGRMCRIGGMKTCLGSLLLVPTLTAIALTVVYHASVNAELRFEPRDSNTEYINTERSYRPPVKKQKPASIVTPAVLPRMESDDVAEEA